MIRCWTLAYQIFENGQLGRNLGPADNRRDRRFGCSKSRIERLELALHRAARIGREQMRQAFGGRMRAMRCAEGIVDVEIAVMCDGLRKVGIVGLLAGPETGVVEQTDIAIAQDADRLLDHWPGDFGNEHQFPSQITFSTSPMHHAGREHRRALATGASEMGEKQNLSPALAQFKNGRFHRVRRGLHPSPILPSSEG
jgi:hypothetical protein